MANGNSHRAVVKLEKVKKLMELVGLTATLRRDFNILRHPFGPIPIPIELVRIKPEEEENFITKFAEMYGEYWNECELDEVITFLTNNPSGRKLIDPLFREETVAGCKRFIDEIMERVEPKYVSILRGSDVVH